MTSNEQLVKLRTNMMKVSARLRIIFSIFLLMYCVFAVALFAISIKGSEGFSSREIISAASLLFTFALGGYSIFVLRAMFSSTARGNSPFTQHQSLQFLILGILLMLGVGVEAWASVSGYLYTASTPTANAAVSAIAGTTVMRFNATMFFSAIGCFCLSYIFKYGSLLQWMYDETV